MVVVGEGPKRMSADYEADEESTYGFEWRPDGSDVAVRIERLVTIAGRHVFAAGTYDRAGKRVAEVQVAVSKGGRSIRVWDTATGKELKR